MWSNYSIPEKMQKYSELIDNSISDNQIQEGVGQFGYTLAKLNIGKHLLSDAAALVTTQGNENGDQVHADNDFKVLRAAISKKHSTNRKISRIALGNNSLLLTVNLGVKGSPSDVYSEWMKELDQFYGNALKSKEILTAFAEFNLTAEKLKDQVNSIAELKALKLNQKKEMGEAQMATKERDKQIIELEKWVRDYKVVATIAFEDQPQILEKLGIIVRS